MGTSTSGEPRRRRAAVIAALAVVVPAAAAADPIRLRGDALATAETPAGLLSLSARDRFAPWLSAEAVVWFGAGSDRPDDATGDVLVISVEARDLQRHRAIRIGRQVVTAGALRPVHLDGAGGRIRVPWAIDVEAFGGVPVVPRFGVGAYDWLYGARLSRGLGPARIGVAWLERRDHGALDTRELAVDAVAALGKTLDLSAGAAYDTVQLGLAEARAAATWNRRALRLELFAVQRTAAHLLPATSLFSVLGDVPARRGGTSARWRAAPRLDVTATLAVRGLDGDVAEDLAVGTRLRLDDRGASSIGLELERQGGDATGWTGARASGRWQVCATWAVAAEAELVRLDVDRGTGTLWPWGLAAVTWRPNRDWDAAAAIEASASPEVEWRIDALARLSRRWEGP